MENEYYFKFTTKVVLFGAGASHGSIHVNPYPPPLGHKLFDELKLHFPNTWRKLSSKYDHFFKDNFEFGMEKISVLPETQYYVNYLMRDMRKYFCNFESSNDSNLYTQFLNHLKDSFTDIIFASLDYDLLFELSGRKIGLEVDIFLIVKIN